MTAVRLSASAAAYLRAEVAYLHARSPQAAQRFLTAIREAERNLRRFPELGAERGRLPIPGARTLVTGDDLLDYVYDGETVRIVTIRHHRQRPLVPDDEEDDGTS